MNQSNTEPLLTIYSDLDTYIQNNKEPESDIRYSRAIYDSEEAEVEHLKNWLRRTTKRPSNTI